MHEVELCWCLPPQLKHYKYLPFYCYVFVKNRSILYVCMLAERVLWDGYNRVFARIERGQGAVLGKGDFCARSIIFRALLRVILHFEGTMGKITYLLT